MYFSTVMTPVLHFGVLVEDTSWVFCGKLLPGCRWCLASWEGQHPQIHLWVVRLMVGGWWFQIYIFFELSPSFFFFLGVDGGGRFQRPFFSAFFGPRLFFFLGGEDHDLVDPNEQTKISAVEIGHPQNVNSC